VTNATLITTANTNINAFFILLLLTILFNYLLLYTCIYNAKSSNVDKKLILHRIVFLNAIILFVK
jgi:hypothetical protein